MRFAFLLVLLVSVPAVSAYPIISEVMPNPADEAQEWIEIRNIGVEKINVSSWILSDGEGNDSLTCNGIPGCSMETDEEFFLILGKGINPSLISTEEFTYYYTADSKIGNGLSNSEENIRIESGAYSMEMGYQKTDEGKSWSFTDRGFVLCQPTPGKPNCAGTSQETAEEEKPVMEISSDQVFQADEPVTYSVAISNPSCGEINVSSWVEDLDGRNLTSKGSVTRTGCRTVFEKSWIPENANGTEGYLIIASMGSTRKEKLVVVKGSRQSEQNKTCECGSLQRIVVNECDDKKKENQENISAQKNKTAVNESANDSNSLKNTTKQQKSTERNSTQGIKTPTAKVITQNRENGPGMLDSILGFLNSLLESITRARSSVG